MKKTLMFSSSALVAIFLLTGCGSGGEKTEDISNMNAGGIDFGDEEGPQFTSPSMDTLAGKQQQFPSRYPITRYPNTRVAFVNVRPNIPPGFKNQVMLESTDKPNVVRYFYTERMIKEGWKKTKEYTNPIYSSTYWVKGDQECEIRVSPDPMETKNNIQLLVGPRRTD